LIKILPQTTNLLKEVRKKIKITIVYDNEVTKKGLKADWGFSALIETENASPILFDTGDNGSILLHT
jgi:metal-dependent hydrolase (beta-lactamase superfamily II)